MPTYGHKEDCGGPMAETRVLAEPVAIGLFNGLSHFRAYKHSI